MFDLIAQIPLVGGLLATLLPFVIVLGIVVFVHEYGHYIVARWCGIHAETFSVGFGPELLGWTDKRGTHWRIAALPLGGYVKYLGDADPSSRADASFQAMSAEEARRSFPGAPLWARSASIAAGPFANFILSIVVFAGIASWTGVARDVPVIGPVPPSVAAETPLREGDRILSVDGEAVETFVALREAFGGIDAGAEAVVLLEREGARLSVDLPYPNPPFVVGVRPLSSASRAGIEPGDLIVGVDGVRIGTISALQDYVELREGQDVTVTIRRGDALLDLTMEPRVEDVQEPDGSFDRRAIIGVTVSGYLAPQTEFPGVLSALRIGVERTYGVIATSLNGLYHIIVGDIGAENIQGPVGIAQISGETASRGFVDLILLVGILSTAIGMMNLFPIPVLDGGHLLFNAWEAVTGHPPSGRALDIAMGLGLASILSLMVFATYNDLARLLSFWA